MNLEDVLIIVSAIETREEYLARSYPDDDYDNNGRIELYGTPVYKVLIQSAGHTKEWKALRFMPYWNDPLKPNPHYRTKGWVNSGIHIHEKKVVKAYIRNYRVQNRPSPHDGAIQIRDSFLIHAGPENLLDEGWGAAGCVEIIGDFSRFKADIHELSGSKKKNYDDAILELVAHKKLFVQVDYAMPPAIKSNFRRYIK